MKGISYLRMRNPANGEVRHCANWDESMALKRQRWEFQHIEIHDTLRLKARRKGWRKFSAYVKTCRSAQ